MSGDSPLSGDATQSSGPREGDRPPLSKDVFVSYASQDVAVANSVVEALERQGIRCWIAPRDVTPGEFYADAIVHAIDTAQALVLVLSQHAAVSHHILREVERASSKRHPVISLRIDRAALPAGLEYFLNTSQWLDASEGEPSRVFPKLVEAVRNVLGRGSASGNPDSTPAVSKGDPIRAPPRRSLRRFVVAVVGLVAVVICGFAINQFWLSKHVAAEKPETQTSTTVAFAPPPHSIAVLPFVNMSGDASQEYFSDGISEELLNSLSRLNDLEVVARTSSFSFKGKDVDVSTIAHKLNVGAILEGSVRRAGNTVRITVQLINAVSGFHMWSQTYDRSLSDILKVQTEVATAVAIELKVKLSGDEAGRIEAGGTTNPDAYDAYLRGEQLYSKAIGGKAWRSTLAFFNQAITLDPKYAFAYAGRARALGNAAIFVAAPGDRKALREQALAAAEQAVALAPASGEAHSVLAVIRAFGLLNFRDAAPEHDHAVSLAPGSAQVQRRFGDFESMLGHQEQAIAANRRAVSLDPQNVLAHLDLGLTLRFARRLDEGLAAMYAAQALNPDSHYVEAQLVDTLIDAGATEQARQRCAAPAARLDDEDRYSCLAKVYQALGQRGDAQAALKNLRALGGDRLAYEYAKIYARWGDSEAALRWLARAEQLRDPGFQTFRVESAFDPIRNEPRFKAIESRLNFPP